MYDRKTDIAERSKKLQTQDNDQQDDDLGSKKVYKKTSPNSKLTLYLCQRDLVVAEGKMDRLHGVLLLDTEFIDTHKIYGQITLTFRYGREDEEVMGLKFCNEAIMCLSQLYPPYPDNDLVKSPLQDALVRRLGSNAFPFTMEITPLAPPSVQLVPAKEYNGAPIGTFYDVRAYLADCLDEKLHRLSMVKMGIRVVQMPSFGQQLLGNECNIKRQQFKLFGKQDTFECSNPKSHFTKTESEQHFTQLKNENKKPLLEKKCRALERKSSFLRPFFRNNFSDFEQAKKIIQNAKVGTNQMTEPSQSDINIKMKMKITHQATDRIKPELESTISETDDDGDGDEESDFVATANNKLFKKLETNDEYQTTTSSSCLTFADIPPPHASIDKPFLLSDGRVELQTTLNKAVYAHGESVQVEVTIHNNSNKSIRRIKIFIVQHVDVCMFSNGKFKNVVSFVNAKEDCPIGAGTSTTKSYNLKPCKGTTKNWIALEDYYNRPGVSLASTIMPDPNSVEERNVFAIYISYYVKVKVLVSAMGGELSLKLPFIIMPKVNDEEPDDQPNNKTKSKDDDFKLETDTETSKLREDKGNS